MSKETTKEHTIKQLLLLTDATNQILDYLEIDSYTYRLEKWVYALRAMEQLYQGNENEAIAYIALASELEYDSDYNKLNVIINGITITSRESINKETLLEDFKKTENLLLSTIHRDLAEILSKINKKLREIQRLEREIQELKDAILKTQTQQQKDP